jgi:DNA invertase Pin-like site-specific DNA recombinase
VRVVGYCRVSRHDLKNANQEIIIRDFCKRQGWDDLTIFNEEESTRKTRPIKMQLLKDLREGKYDVLVCTRLDRWARSTIELVFEVEELIQKGIRIIFVQNGFDFKKDDYSSVNMLTLRIFSAFAEFEREIIRERTLEGLERARREGKKLGRPRKRKRTDEKKEEQTEPPKQVMIKNEVKV